MGDQNPHTDPREVKRVDQLEPGDVIFDDAAFPDVDPVLRTVRVAEPIAESPGRYLVVYAGAHTDNVVAAEEYVLATAAEVKQHDAECRDAEKRAQMRAGLVKLIDLIDGGLPLPAFIRVEFPCMPDHESVRGVAEAIAVEPVESLNGGRPQIEAESVLATGSDGRREVEFKAWHLASKAVES